MVNWNKLWCSVEWVCIFNYTATKSPVFSFFLKNVLLIFALPFFFNVGVLNFTDPMIKLENAFIYLFMKLCHASIAFLIFVSVSFPVFGFSVCLVKLMEVLVVSNKKLKPSYVDHVYVITAALWNVNCL